MASFIVFMLFALGLLILIVGIIVGIEQGERKTEALGDTVIETRKEDDFQHAPRDMVAKPTAADHAQESAAEDAYMLQDEEALYEIVASEIAVRRVKKGLWAKAFAQCEGDPNRTKALYIKLRVQALKDEAAHNAWQAAPATEECAQEENVPVVQGKIFDGEMREEKLYASDTGAKSVVADRAQETSAPVEQSNTFLGGNTHPWRRYFARMVDTWTTYFMPGFVLGFMLGDFNLLAFLAFLVMQLFVEAGLISLFGATPAKWLFGIRVVHPDGSLLTFPEALSRSFLVFVQGLGFCIPFIAAFTQLFAYWRLTKTGTTRWDVATNAVVHHEKWDLLQTLGCIVVVLVALMIHGYAMNLMVASLAKDVMNEMNRKEQRMQRKYGQSEEPATSKTLAAQGALDGRGNDLSGSASNVENKKTSLQNANEGAGDDVELAAIKQLAAEGHAGAQFILGTRYNIGQGVRQDYTQARYWYEKSATQGNAFGQAGLGLLYENGQSVRQDYAQARYWYEKAAAQGNAWAQSRLGMLYQIGLGGRLDYIQARYWYEQAAAQGFADAQAALDMMNAEGRRVWQEQAAPDVQWNVGSWQDYTQARARFERAAIQGDADAQFNLGRIYAEGLGVQQDKQAAMAWFGKACKAGFQDGCDKYQELEDEGY